MVDNNGNGRQINRDLQEIVHLANAMKSLANVIGTRVDDIIIREGRRKRNGDRKEKSED